MPATLLAVDDSQTMRKVLEMTFAGEDMRVVTAEGFDTALALVRSESPAVVITDITLPGKTGYDLCQAIKQLNPSLPVLLLSSKLHPYDPGKGLAAKADGNLDKPFDTQQIIDRVKGLLTGDKRAAPEPARAAPRAAAPTPYRAPSPLSSTMVGTPPARRSVPKPAAPVATPSSPKAAPAPPQNLRATIDFSARRETPVRPAPPASAPTPAARPAAPTPAPAPAPAAHAPAPAPAPAPAAPVAAAVAARVDGDMAAKLADLGLSKDQVEAVLALSHDVVERVVWEVVPVLAETMIKEEIKRLMAE